jgi:integrase
METRPRAQDFRQSRVNRGRPSDLPRIVVPNATLERLFDAFKDTRSNGLFQSRVVQPMIHLSLVQRAKLQGVTPHTLRHSFASVAGDLGFTESTIAAMLGHSAGSITSRYIHHLDTVLVAAADKVAKAIHEMMTDCGDQRVSEATSTAMRGM